MIRNGVFIDTSAFFPLVNDRDRGHRLARTIHARVIAERRRVITSNFVLAETHALLLNRIDRRIALRTVQRILAGTTTVVRVGVEDEDRALDILTRYTDKDFSYTNATSFAVMERLGIGTAFTFDHHFGQYGFQALTADPG